MHEVRNYLITNLARRLLANSRNDFPISLCNHLRGVAIYIRACSIDLRLNSHRPHLVMEFRTAAAGFHDTVTVLLAGRCVHT